MPDKMSFSRWDLEAVKKEDKMKKLRPTFSSKIFLLRKITYTILLVGELWIHMNVVTLTPDLDRHSKTAYTFWKVVWNKTY